MKPPRFGAWPHILEISGDGEILAHQMPRCFFNFSAGIHRLPESPTEEEQTQKVWIRQKWTRSEGGSRQKDDEIKSPSPQPRARRP